MEEKSASQQIDDIVKTHGGWKGEVLARLREVILDADSSIVEEVKWKTKSRPEGLPVWSYNGNLCFAEIWKDNVKLLFPQGSHLDDPNKLFNARLQGKDIRAIEYKEGNAVNGKALKILVQEAIELNRTKK